MAHSRPSLLAQIKGGERVQQLKGNSLQHAKELIEKLQAHIDSPQGKRQMDYKPKKSFMELKSSLWSSARVVAGFFLPSTDNSLMSQRYWALINAVLEVSLARDYLIKLIRDTGKL